MNLLVKAFPRRFPAITRKKILKQLCIATASSFGCTAPKIDHLSSAESLRAYAIFTKEQAEKVRQSGRDITEVKNQLYQNAFPLGARLRKWISVKTVDDVVEIGQSLYQAIGVEMQGNSAGCLTIKRCFYSQFYDAFTCDLISALDDGIYSGLSEGRRLVFSQRLTEGQPCCLARLVPFLE